MRRKLNSHFVINYAIDNDGSFKL